MSLETNWHSIQINLLVDSIYYHWRDRDDFFAGGDMFIFYCTQQLRDQDYRGADFLLVKNIDGRVKRESWVVWEEYGRCPNLIIELASPSSLAADLGKKKNLYEQVFRTREYFCYDPVTQHLYGWKLYGDIYEELKPGKHNCLWSQELELWLGKWEGGELFRINGPWVRFYKESGNEIKPVLTSAEADAERADNAEAELNKLRALLKEKGIKL